MNQRFALPLPKTCLLLNHGPMVLVLAVGTQSGGEVD